MKKMIMIILLCSSIVASNSYTSFAYEVLDSTQKVLDLVRKEKDAVVILNFFASFCTACRKEVPELNMLYKEKGTNAVVYGISFDEYKEPLDAFIQQTGLAYPVYIATSSVAEDFGVQIIPQIFIYKNGILAKRIEGLITYKQLEKILQTL